MSRRTTASVVDGDLNARLNRWAEWLRRRIDGGPTAYGSSPLVSLMQLGVRVQSTPADHLGGGASQLDLTEIHATHAAVLRLSDTHQVVVAAYWIKAWPVTRVAREMGVSPITIRNALANINGKLQFELRDLLHSVHNSPYSVRVASNKPFERGNGR